ncbi:hypothetical protein DPMN_062753 [Dreissena polymorpha]|uniref:Uncharacterized protein n=1 Tax=Dreissena polymorpha TaxID=45954 RepID=A0A9D4HJJ2_DREPO|nr:hypothetical protein DPMN_062753 [Dreissena polymorpha]
MDAWKTVLRDLHRQRRLLPQRPNTLDVNGPTRPDDRDVTEATSRRPSMWS